MENTVYGVFKEIVKNNKNEIAIIENDRTLTFEELSEMVDMIGGRRVEVMPVVLKEGNDYGNNN